MDKLINSLIDEQQKIINKNSNDVITNLIMNDYLVKSNDNVMDQVNKKINGSPENKLFNGINKILNTDNYENDYNKQIEKTENFKNKIFSIVYNLLINKTNISDYDELVNFYNPNNIESIEIDNYLEQNINEEKEKQLLLKLIKILL